MAPRAARRKVVVASSDAEEDEEAKSDYINTDPPKPPKGSHGKPQSIKNGTSSRSRGTNVTSNATEPEHVTPQPSARKARTKSKATSDDSSKQSVKPIYSFFNTVTQKQQGSQGTARPDKVALLHGQVETIQDDSDDDEPPKDSSHTNLSQGSSTALAVRKRKLGCTQSLGDETCLPPSATQKFRKTSDGGNKSSFSPFNSDKRPWTEQFAPADLSELAVHKRKVADVREWLETTFRGKRQNILVLKGAAGTGKTTTVRLLAKALGIELLEWTDPGAVDTDGNTSAAARFEEFVTRAGKVSGLSLSTDADTVVEQALPMVNESTEQKQRSHAILVEEFPNTFSRTSTTLQSFRSVLTQFVSTAISNHSVPTPMILVISETLLSTNTAAADSFTAHRLLGPELCTNPHINVIEFNSIAPTFMIKALETIVVKEARKSGRRRTPGPLVIKQLAEIGDIRSAISSLEFLCVRGDDGDWSGKVTFTKSKQGKSQPAAITKAEEEALKLITNRESSLGLFHSVGKVVYNKRVEARDIAQPPPWLPQHRRSKVPETDPDTLVDELGTEISTFIAALHENYVLSCGSAAGEDTLDSLSGCIDNMSDSDLMSLDRLSFGTRAFSGSAADTLRQDELCFQVAVQGVLFNLPYPVQRVEFANGRRGDAHKMFYPASLRLWRKREELEDQLDMVIGRLADMGAAGAAQSKAAKATGGTGVATWRENNALAPNSSGSFTTTDIRPQLGAGAKNEILIDRLPYLAHILSGPKASPASRSLRDRISAITRPNGLTLSTNEEEGADGEEGEASPNAEQQWATDRPDIEGTTPRKQRPPRKPALVFENAKLLPVENQVASLVLEDDDIED